MMVTVDMCNMGQLLELIDVFFSVLNFAVAPATNQMGVEFSCPLLDPVPQTTPMPPFIPFGGNTGIPTGLYRDLAPVFFNTTPCVLVTCVWVRPACGIARFECL